MPPVEIAAFADEAVGAGRGQPAEFADIVGREPHAIVDLRTAIGIVMAAASLLVEQPAADVGVVDAAGVLVLELVETAAAAAVAQALPLVRRHLGQRLAPPEGAIRHGAFLSVPI